MVQCPDRLGFINRNDTKEDVFVHWAAINRTIPGSFCVGLEIGELKFDVLKGERSTEAANVSDPSVVPVKGSHYDPNRHRFCQFILWSHSATPQPMVIEAPSGRREAGSEWGES